MFYDKFQEEIVIRGAKEHNLKNLDVHLPRRLIQDLAAHSQSVVVMTKVAARLLASVYHVSGPGVRVIPHGVPVAPFDRDEACKARLGLAGRRVPAVLPVRQSAPLAR